jgi:GNAT superfamily N-acetyltransferase
MVGSGTTPRARPANPAGGLTVRPLVPERWDDLVRLFGARGACGGCWCMSWRVQAAEFRRGKGAGNRRALRRIVAAGEEPGLIAYRGDEPIGWIALAPRDRYPRLAASRVLAPVDDAPVWSISCFFVAARERGRGVTVRLLAAAVEHVRRRGGRVLEGYPYEPRQRLPGPFVWTGLASAFRRAGFTEVARRSATRPIMRFEIAARRGPAGGGGKG